MANLISYDLPVLQEAKREYDSYAQEINAMMAKINSLVTGKLAAGWKGDSYNAFLAQNDGQVKPAFAKMQEALNTIGVQIANAEKNAIAADQASRVQ